MADPYKLIDDTYQGALDQINKQRGTGETQKTSREKQAKELHTETNRGFEIKYQQAVNPFGFNAEQRGVMGTGISEYFRNAALGSLLQGVGRSAQTYQQSLDTIGADWEDFLLELAGMEQSARTARNQAIMQQQQIDIENARAAAAAAAASSGGGGGTSGLDLGDDGGGSSAMVIDYTGAYKDPSKKGYVGWTGSGVTSQNELDLYKKAKAAQANKNYTPRSYF